MPNVLSEQQIEQFQEFFSRQKTGWKVQRFPPYGQIQLELFSHDVPAGSIGVDEVTLHFYIKKKLYYKTISPEERQELRRIIGDCR